MRDLTSIIFKIRTFEDSYKLLLSLSTQTIIRCSDEILFKGPLVASAVVSTTDYRSRSHRGDKSGPEVRTTSSLHLVGEILHLVHLVTMSLVHLVAVSLVHLVDVIMIVCRTWPAAVRKLR